MHQWKKFVAERNVAAWLERLASVDPERLAVVERPGVRSQSLEVYCATRRDAEELARQFGGTVREVRLEDWQPAPATSPGKPLSIAGGRLLVTAHEEEFPALRDRAGRGDVLCIPAAMAFGTGEHATTAMCLRLLVETSRKVGRAGGNPWNALDLGTGSGILALAARKLGAAYALGLDNDRHAVRTARENAVLNEVTRGVKFGQADLLISWQAVDTTRSWAVITANLFSNLLVALMPSMARTLATDGYLILSGILASQADEVVAAAQGAGLEIQTRRKRGKWVALLARR